ncbi:hypothetical protein [Nitrobacter hamburgensis]|uniref:hypothetical protein n=1 Tax=Nitrobacter hamburgensis TaxID=912 RepID=UPI00059C7083|nr:hypothetical protein [Nitrobacter hamburgensis]
MLFNTYQFTVVFVPLALLTFYLLRRFAPSSLALASIVVASLLFYAYWRADYVPILVLSILIYYGIGAAILAWPGLTARVALFVGVTFNRPIPRDVGQV